MTPGRSGDHRGAAELQKLAHLLDVSTERLEFLSGVPAEDLRVLRGQINDALFEADRPAFAKVAGLSKTIPGALAARITRLTLSPLIAARTAELLDPHRALDLVRRLPDSYLADVCAVLDPARAPEVIANIPPERVAKVGAELANREQWVVIGGFVSHLTGPALQAAAAFFDSAQLLRIGFVLDDTSRLDEVTALLSEAQLDGLLTAAAAGPLWIELDELLAQLGPTQMGRVAARFAAGAESTQAAAAAAAADGLLSPASWRQLQSPPAPHASGR